jgi:MFS family permease
MSAWSLGGLFFALGTSLATELLGTHNVVATSFGAFGIGIPGAMAQLLTRLLSPIWGAVYGGLSLAVGAGLVVVATVSGSAAAFVVGLTLTGVGFGVAFLGGLRNLAAGIPHAHRAAVMSAFYIVGYLSLSVPAVMAGILLPHLGLEHTFTIFGSLTGVVALLVAVEAYRTRPRRGEAPAVV